MVFLHPWEYPTHAWQLVHIDFAGPVCGYIWLIYVDANSKYPGAIPLTTTTANSTCNAVLDVFSHFGSPEQIVLDNGPPVDSTDFASFCRTNGIRHRRSSPYHRQSNGQGERFVQTFQDVLQAATADQTTARNRAYEFLLRNRVTPHGTTETAPAILLLDQLPRIKLDMLHQDPANVVRKH